MFRRTKVCSGVLVALGGALSLGSAPVFGQPAQTFERVEITGSSIRRVEAEGALPVTVLKKEDIERTGATSVVDLLQRLPTVQGGTVEADAVGGSARLWEGLLETAARRDALWLNAAYTFSDFRFDDDPVFGDNELPGAPRHFLRAELLYKHPSGVYFGPNVEWVPEAFYVDSANTLATEAYALWGAKLGFDDGEPVTAYIEGRNLADEAYISSASIATKADATSTLFEPGGGRAVYAGVQYRW